MLLCVTVNTQEVPQNPAMVRQTRARRVSNEYSVHTSASGTEGEFMDEDDLDFRSLSSSSSSRDSDDDSSDDDDVRRTGSKRVARAEKESPVLVSLSLRSEDHGTGRLGSTETLLVLLSVRTTRQT